MDARRAHFVHVFRVQAHLGRNDRHHQFYPVLLEGLAHAFYQGVVALQVELLVDYGVELFIAVQPLVTAQHHPRAPFVEQLEVQGGPEVGAQALDRKLVVVVGFHRLGPAPVEHGGVVVGTETEEAARRPHPQHQQGQQEQGDVEHT